MNRRRLLSLLGAHILFACGPHMPNTPANAQELALVRAFPKLTFSSPVFLTHGGDATDRIFVVEQAGIIKIFQNDSEAASAATFLDIRDRVTAGGEMGLLGLAFHPAFPNNGQFFVNYTTSRSGPRRTVIARFSASGDQADPSSEFILMEVNQPFGNHNGGMLAFGPDGFLYISFGDGGSGGDPSNNGQRPSTLLGSILRIDVDNQAPGLNYAIPVDNPFANATDGTRKETFAFGLRNPWRFSIDQSSREIWAGDVGQNRREEIDLIEAGGNYGWNTMEGFDCFNPASGCDRSGLKLPVVDYGRDDGFSVTGGYIYRGPGRPELTGAYIYGDFGSGNIWLLRYQNNQIVADSLLLATNLSIASFGVDQQNELYIVDLAGRIYQFSEEFPTSASNEPDLRQTRSATLTQNFPNPFNPTTSITFTIRRTTDISLTVYDILGRKIRTLLNETRPGGTYSVVWDGKNAVGRQVASGHYFYRIEAGEFNSTRTMLLLK